MSEIRLCLEGQDARQAARDLAQALAQGLGVEPQVEEQETRPAQGDRDWGTALAIATLVLALPGGILAGLDLKDRYQAQEKAQVILEISREVCQRYPDLRITVSGPAGARVKITTLEPAELVDLASQSESE